VRERCRKLVLGLESPQISKSEENPTVFESALSTSVSALSKRGMGDKV